MIPRCPRVESNTQKQPPDLPNYQRPGFTRWHLIASYTRASWNRRSTAAGRARGAAAQQRFPLLHRSKTNTRSGSAEALPPAVPSQNPATGRFRSQEHCGELLRDGTKPNHASHSHQTIFLFLLPFLGILPELPGGHALLKPTHTPHPVPPMPSAQRTNARSPPQHRISTPYSAWSLPVPGFSALVFHSSPRRFPRAKKVG